MPWRVLAPPPSHEAKPLSNPALRSLARAYVESLIARGTYTVGDLAALGDPSRECSWMAAPTETAGPLTTIALSGERVVGGVELWQNQRDNFWTLEVLIRDQAPEFRGVGFAVVNAAVSWWRNHASMGLQLRAYAMQGEPIALSWWTRYAGRPPDLSDAYIRSRNHKFPALGWIVNPGRPV